MTGDYHFQGTSGNYAGIGPGARGTNITSGENTLSAEVTAALAELRRQLDRHAHALDDPEAATAALDEAEDELSSGDARPGRLRMLLSAVSGAAGSVTAVAGAVAAVKGVLGI